MSTEDLLKNNIQEESVENSEVGIENSSENPKEVSEKITLKIVERTGSSINKADYRIGTAVNMGASQDAIDEGKKTLTEVRSKMKELENEYLSKIEGVVNQ